MAGWERSWRLSLAAKDTPRTGLSISDEMVPSIVAEDGIVLWVYCWLAALCQGLVTKIHVCLPSFRGTESDAECHPVLRNVIPSGKKGGLAGGNYHLFVTCPESSVGHANFLTEMS